MREAEGGNTKRVIADWIRKAAVTTNDVAASVARTCIVGPWFLISRFLISNGRHGKSRGPQKPRSALRLLHDDNQIIHAKVPDRGSLSKRRWMQRTAAA